MRVVEGGHLFFSQLIIYRKLLKSCHLSFLLSGHDCILVKRWGPSTPQLASSGAPVPGSALTWRRGGLPPSCLPLGPQPPAPDFRRRQHPLCQDICLPSCSVRTAVPVPATAHFLFRQSSASLVALIKLSIDLCFPIPLTSVDVVFYIGVYVRISLLLYKHPNPTEFCVLLGLPSDT